MGRDGRQACRDGPGQPLGVGPGALGLEDECCV